MSAFAAGRSGRRLQAREVSQPVPELPDSVEGTWVSDDDAADPIQPPEQLGLDPFEIDQSMAEGPCDCEECQAAAGYDPGRRHRGGCGWCDPLWCSDLWNEVHAHRRIYAEVDYLSFWQRGNLLPPLVTTSPPGTPQSQAGGYR